jgi:hypothetical protein
LGRLYLLAGLAVAVLIAIWFVVANGRTTPGVDDNPLLQERPGGSAINEAVPERP